MGILMDHGEIGAVGEGVEVMSLQRTLFPGGELALLFAQNSVYYLSKVVRNRAISYYAYLLDQYNNGYIGSGHCSE
ncbi:MAG: hypothetical protein ACUVWZ_11060 [Anaerolineae bacterium]